MKKFFLNALILFISLLITLFIGEGMCRLFLDPVDYLTVDLASDPILDHKIPNDAIGYDEWGFRNDKVPQKADVVTIGDSQTFGNNATKDDSWPKVYGQLTDQTVYNMSLGSYCPVQYHYLLKNKALKLDPERVIVGFYLGNDAMGSYFMSYYNKNWHHLRDSSLVNKIDRSGKNIIDYYIQEDPVNRDEQFLGHLRAFLSHHSILYRLVVHGPVLGYFKRKLQLIFKQAKNDRFTRLIIPDSNIDEGFRPIHRANKMDIDNLRIREGLRIALNRINKMSEICAKNDIKFNVLLIPSKVLVYAEYLTASPEIKNYDDVQRLLDNEREMLEVSKAFFDKHHISYLSPVEALRKEIGRHRIYPANYDDHPNAYGYSIIAKSVKDQLNYTEEPVGKPIGIGAN